MTSRQVHAVGSRGRWTSARCWRVLAAANLGCKTTGRPAAAWVGHASARAMPTGESRREWGDAIVPSVVPSGVIMRRRYAARPRAQRRRRARTGSIQTEKPELLVRMARVAVSATQQRRDGRRAHSR